MRIRTREAVGRRQERRHRRTRAHTNGCAHKGPGCRGGGNRIVDQASTQAALLYRGVTVGSSRHVRYPLLRARPVVPDLCASLLLSIIQLKTMYARDVADIRQYEYGAYMTSLLVSDSESTNGTYGFRLRQCGTRASRTVSKYLFFDICIYSSLSI